MLKRLLSGLMAIMISITAVETSEAAPFTAFARAPAETGTPALVQVQFRGQPGPRGPRFAGPGRGFSGPRFAGQRFAGPERFRPGFAGPRFAGPGRYYGPRRFYGRPYPYYGGYDDGYGVNPGVVLGLGIATLIQPVYYRHRRCFHKSRYVRIRHSHFYAKRWVRVCRR